MQHSINFKQLINKLNPIVQAPMFGVTTPEMVAAANKANCLGSLALGDLNAEKSIEEILKTKKLTNDTFAVNIFVHQLPKITKELEEKYNLSKSFIEQLAQVNHIDVVLPKLEEIKVNSYQEQVDAIIDEDCKILSFTFGNLDEVSIQKLKSNGTILIGTCTSLEEALTLEKAGIDCICVQGWEAGGHRGSFVSENIPEIGGLSLLAKISEQVNIPIIYAGGIYNAKTFVAVQKLGASAVQVGSLLLNSKESGLHDFERERLKQVNEDEIILTKSFSGRYARGIKNIFTSTIDNSDYILPYPYQNKLTAALRKIAKQNKNADFTNIWVGQSISHFSEKSTTDILLQLVEDIKLMKL